MGIFSNCLFRIFQISWLFAILPDNVETDRSIQNLSDIHRHILKNPVSAKQLFQNLNDFWECFEKVILYFIKKFRIVCKPARKPRNCQINEKYDGIFWGKKLSQNPVSLKSLWIKNTGILKICYHCFFKSFFKLMNYLQTLQISGTHQIHQKAKSNLSGKSIEHFKVFQTNYK